MAHKTDAAAISPGKELSLPVQVATPVDIGRLLREIEVINESLLQMQLRQPGQQVSLPKISRLMDQIVQLNGVNLLQETDRQRLLQSLQAIKANAPILHVSFSAEPSVTFLEKLVAWLRREIDSRVLVTVGLQPAIGAGCVVRTTNKQFNFSLRQNFKNKRDLLRDQLALSEKTS